MKNPATYRRAMGALGLIATAVLTCVSVLLMPEMDGSQADRIASIAAAGTTATVSAFLFLLAQLPFLAGALALGHLLRTGAPVLGNLGTTVLVLGVFGHAASGGVMLIQPVMAADPVNLQVYAALLAAVESSPVVAFMAIGLLGTVLGLLLVSIGLWRARVGPRWVPPALWAFLLVEFVGNSLTTWAGPIAGLLFLAALGALAVTVWRSPEALWTSGADTTAPTGTGEPVAGSPARQLS